MATALLIDLDDTLIDDQGAMSLALLRVRKRHDLLPSVTDDELGGRWDDVGRKLRPRLEKGELTFLGQTRMRLFEVLTLSLAGDRSEEVFLDFLTCYEQSWALLPGALDFLVATSHLPRVILTNSSRPLARRKLEGSSISGSFTGLVTPDDCAASKPDPRIFLCALDLLRIQAQEALMIGDNMETDIKPALALGMRAFHVNPLEAGRTIGDAAIAALRS
jgi:putative hydrolase of the HAD superfamily